MTVRKMKIIVKRKNFKFVTNKDDNKSKKSKKS